MCLDQPQSTTDKKATHPIILNFLTATGLPQMLDIPTGTRRSAMGERRAHCVPSMTAQWQWSGCACEAHRTSQWKDPCIHKTFASGPLHSLALLQVNIAPFGNVWIKTSTTEMPNTEWWHTIVAGFFYLSERGWGGVGGGDSALLMRKRNTQVPSAPGITTKTVSPCILCPVNHTGSPPVQSKAALEELQYKSQQQILNKISSLTADHVHKWKKT